MAIAPPVVTTSGSTGQTYTLGGSAVAVDSGLTVTSYDTDITGATVTIDQLSVGRYAPFHQPERHHRQLLRRHADLDRQCHAGPIPGGLAVGHVLHHQHHHHGHPHDRRRRRRQQRFAHGQQHGSRHRQRGDRRAGRDAMRADSINSTAGQTVTVDSAVTVSSFDTDVTGATVTIGGSYQTGDTLHFTTQNGISVVSNAGGVLTLTGTATPAQYQTALQSVTFSSTSTSTGDSERVDRRERLGRHRQRQQQHRRRRKSTSPAPITVTEAYDLGFGLDVDLLSYLASHSLGSSTWAMP